jgi:hypothetical protein
MLVNQPRAQGTHHPTFLTVSQSTLTRRTSSDEGKKAAW